MRFRYQRRYAGTLQGVIFDWAGTTVDYGCFAPTNVFIEGFKAKGIDITLREARTPMGKHKRDHIADIIAMPRISAEWERVHHTAPTDADVQTIYEAFLPKQIEVVTEYADLIPGTVATVAALRERGLKIGSCSGYLRPIMDALVPVAAEKGYQPDAVVTADEVVSGRPAPWMALKVAEIINVYPVSAVVKVGDTVTDIEEGLNAGMWTVGVSQSGNELGLTYDAVQALSVSELDHCLKPIEQKLLQAGAHFVVRDINEVPQVVDRIQQLLADGVMPSNY
jgi:phosphonoacetaldehyde hydrolase